MKNWKDKVLGIFAGIGIMSLLMASNSQEPKVNYGTPESHVWEIYKGGTVRLGTLKYEDVTFMINKETGEVRSLTSLTQYYNMIERENPAK